MRMEEGEGAWCWQRGSSGGEVEEPWSLENEIESMSKKGPLKSHNIAGG